MFLIVFSVISFSIPMFLGLEFSNIPFNAFSSDFIIGLSFKIKFDWLYFEFPLLQINSNGKLEQLSFDNNFFSQNLLLGLEYNYTIFKDSANVIKASISADFPFLNLIFEKRIQPLNLRFGLGLKNYSYEIDLGKVVRFEFFNDESKNLIYRGIYYLTPGLNL
ncbi:MAG: hypothetical protein J7J43_06960 [Thermosipho sp. (in: Bacteria)]|nr:hypothetical protein [Thermosipho sp. (in: thermotogales)]MCD6105496.1 hypothetical protein [Thermosipho sp. (in: thermotogales)]